MVVEDGDHQDRAEVVDDGEREQEGAQRDRKLGAHDRQDCQGEGDVGGHRDAPADRRVCVAEAARHERVEQSRHDHSGERGDHGYDRACGSTQTSQGQLVLELEPGDEEEHREQSVSCPHRERQVKVQRLGADLELGEVVIALAPGRVGPDQSRDRGAQEQATADRLLPQCLEDTDAFAERDAIEHDLRVVHPASARR